MPLITGILLDVSGSMQESIQGDRFEGRRVPWARSIFDVMDNLIKYDVSEENLVFAVGVGADVTDKDKETFDILSTISKNQKTERALTNSDKRRMIDRTLSILRGNGARLIREWVTIDLIQDTVSDSDVILLLEKLENDPKFVSDFVDLLPMACRVPESSFLAVGLSMYQAFTGKRATEYDITELVRKAKDLISQSPVDRSSLIAAITNQSVFRVHDASEILHDCVEEKDLTDSRISELMDTVEPFIYGGTPLCKALRQATDLLTQPKYKDYKKLLFVLSDGEPADGGLHVLPISELRNSDVHVVCSYITRSDLIETKRLYCREEDSWDKAAQFMFRLSSSVETQSLPRTIFIKRDWKIDFVNNETRLFLHVNHPDHIKDACDLAKNVVCCQDALADCLSDVSLDLYINQENRDFEAKEQEGSTCYANATAAVLHLAMKRIVGRDGGYPDFYTLREEMITGYGKHGAYMAEVLQEFCPKYRLHFKYVEKISEALEAIIAKRPVVTTFHLTDEEWDSFSGFYKPQIGNPWAGPKGILTTEEIDIRKRPPGAKLSGHAVVLTSFNNECLHLMNSWGDSWADKGFFRIRNADVLGLEFFDVYWTLNDLSPAEKAYYQEHGKRKAAELIAKLTGLQRAQYECPLCKQKSLVTEFSGKLTRATCPKCKKEFSCGEEGNILALNMYLTSLGS